MNVGKIITAALKQLGILAAGETASGEEIADTVDSLQDILSQWATHKLYVHKAYDIEIPLTAGKPTYLVGKIEGDCCEYELTCCGDVLARPDITAEISSISDKAWLDDEQITLVRDTNDSKKSDVTYQVDYPNWQFTANRGTLLKIKAYTLAFDLCVHDELHLPKQYERALKLTLALEIAPMFGVEPSSLLVVNQRNAVALLKRANITPLYVKNSLGIGVGRCGCH